jgi:hypothetical protein
MSRGTFRTRPDIDRGVDSLRHYVTRIQKDVVGFNEDIKGRMMAFVRDRDLHPTASEFKAAGKLYLKKMIALEDRLSAQEMAGIFRAG